MPRRYLMVCPDRQSASGGIAVLYDIVVTLRRNGYDAALLHGAPTAGYPDYPDKPPIFWSDAVMKLFLQSHMSKPRAVLGRASMMLEQFRGGPNPQLEMKDGDVIVTPEFMMHETVRAFPEYPIVVISQNSFAFANAFVAAHNAGTDLHKHVVWSVGIADICMKQFDMLGFERVSYVPVSPKPDDFPYEESKEKLITYMPRKRPVDATVIDESLRRRDRLRGYELLAIDGVPRSEVAQLLRRSLRVHFPA